MEEFTISDLQLLLHKGYSAEEIGFVTPEDLRGPPEDAVKPLLIDALLSAFNSALLDEGMEV